MKQTAALALSFSLWAGSGGMGWAQDMLVFPNGDRLSGKLLEESGGVYQFVADSVGLLEVPVENAELIRESLETEVEMAVETEPKAGPEPEPKEIPEEAELVGETVPRIRPPWKVRFDLGYTWQSGRAEKNELTIRGQADRKLESTEYQFLGEFLYGQAEGTKNTHRYMGTFRGRDSFSERWFSQSLTRYEADRIREVRNRAEQNVGIGYRFLKAEFVEGSIVPGFTGQYTDEKGESDHWIFLGSVFQDLTWRFSSQYRLEQDFNFLIDPNDSENFIVRFNAGIVGTIRKNISLSVRYQFLYENQVRPNVSKDDQRLITSIGYTF